MQNKTIHRIEGCTRVVLTLLGCGLLRYDRHCQTPHLRSLAVQFRKACFLVLKHTCHIQICQSTESIGDTRRLFRFFCYPINIQRTDDTVGIAYQTIIEIIGIVER